MGTRDGDGAASRSERRGEKVDLVGRASLGDGDENRVVEARVVPAERVAGIDAARARCADRVGGVPSGADGKLLERCPLREHELESSRRQTLLRVGGEG